MLHLCKREEREKMNRELIDILFAALVFSLPFGYIPRAFWQTILGGPYGHDLILYPIIEYSATGVPPIRKSGTAFPRKVYRLSAKVYRLFFRL